LYLVAKGSAVLY